MYSLMSMRTIASSVLKRNCASVLASSVLPVPVGPRNMKLAMGLCGSERPARLRWMASAMPSTASSCPMTRSCRWSASMSSFSRSPCSSRATGMPVHLLITSEMSDSVTSSLSTVLPSACAASNAASASTSCLCRLIRLPYLSSAARFRSYSRSACATAICPSSICSLSCWISDSFARSPSHRSVSSSCLERRLASSLSSLCSLAAAPLSFSAPGLLRLSRSISSFITVRSISSSAVGLLVISILSLAAASSTRSIALSGRKRSAMYRSLSTAASTSALSRIRTPWCSSYRSRRPLSMEMVSATVGCGTSTCWNLRSSAGSFSMYCLYSSSVVAPMHRSSPRASAGLSRLPASTPPAPPPPVPITVWISSMKRMTSPLLSFTSCITAFMRSSNSPRYLAPAMRLPMSSDMTRRSCRLAGTSPATILCARPSDIAVLPTPGSPMRHGLFLDRLERICTVRRISSSRPITGSSLPARASAVRSLA
mmetsp:Transcript_21304/g.72541  ORF Transcript_21304/g.72541 Transcript_21304/m.72541 type:complete len:483 (+) Transcript_21304:618-2066(+)